MSERRGYVYVLSNPSMPGIVKIGRSKYGGQGRAKDLYRNDTGVAEPFELEFEVMCDDCHHIESACHNRLAEFRVNNGREFFRMTPSQARYVIFETLNNVIRAIGVPTDHTHVYIEYHQDTVKPVVELMLDIPSGGLSDGEFGDAIAYMALTPGLCARSLLAKRIAESGGNPGPIDLDLPLGSYH